MEFCSRDDLRRGVHRKGWAPFGAIILSILTACGSTVQFSGSIGTGEPGSRFSDGSLSEIAKSPHGSVAAELNRDNSNRKGLRSAPRTGREESEETAGRNKGFGGISSSSGSVSVGFTTVDDVDTFAKGFGYAGRTGKGSDYAKAMVRDLNARGGVGGRKIDLVIHDQSTAQAAQDINGAAQGACERFTVDRPVSIVINEVIGGAWHETLGACLAKKGVVHVTSSAAMPQRIYDRLGPYLFSPAYSTLERYWKGLVGRLVAQNYFSRWDFRMGQPGNAPVKIGLLSWKNSWAPEFESFMRRELPRRGLSVDSVFRVSDRPERIADEVFQASVKFSSENVSHVIAQMDLQVIMPAFESNRYRPRHALNNISRAATAQGFPEAQDQLGGALGMGIRKAYDVDSRRDPGPVSSQESHCLEIMKDVGLDTSAAAARNFMLTTCEGFNFIRAAFDTGIGSGQDFEDAVARIGTFRSALAFGVAFPGGRSDGLAAGRDLVWSATCDGGSGCFRYSGGNRAI